MSLFNVPAFERGERGTTSCSAYRVGDSTAIEIDEELVVLSPRLYEVC